MSEVIAMWISSKAMVGALSAVAGAVIGAGLFAGSATSGAKAPQRVAAPVPGPVPSVTVPPGVPTNVPPGAAPPFLTLEVNSNFRYGPILVTPAGMTVYRQVGAGVCSTRYHPLLAAAGQRLRLPVLVGGRLGTVTTSYARKQVSYDGWPLYVYSGDHSEGDTNGVGSHWKVIRLAPWGPM